MAEKVLDNRELSARLMALEERVGRLDARARKPEQAIRETLKEIDAALDDIKTGVAGDFRWRLRAC
jgi:hypothetical protein